MYSLALKFLFSSSKNLQSTYQEFNIKVKDVTSLSSTQEAKERNIYDKTKEIWRQTKKHQNQEMAKPKGVNMWQN